MIPVASARTIRSKAQTLPIKLRYTEFHSAHEITHDELMQAMQWLKELAG